jgi:hypothetical protein
MGASLDSRVQISREWRFLLAATKLAPSSRDLALIEKAVTEPLLDWDRVVKLALEQDIAPLVHSALQRMGTGRDAILQPVQNWKTPISATRSEMNCSFKS